MTIKYKVGVARLGGEDKTFPRLVPGETAKRHEIIDKLAQRAARGEADVVAVLTAIREVVAEELRDEQAVRLPGIGTLRLSIKGELDADQRLVTGSVKIKINFTPERSLREDVNSGQRYEYVGE